MNNIVITGRVGKDIEIQTAKNGKEYAKISIAVQRDRKDGDGNRVTDWFNATVFGKSAVFANQYFKKGDGIEVRGRMENNRYTDKDGKNRDSWEIAVEQLYFAVGGKKGDNAPNVTDSAPEGFSLADENIPF